MLKIKKLTVQYGPLPALNEVSLEVKQGEIVSLLGTQWSGKDHPFAYPLRNLEDH